MKQHWPELSYEKGKATFETLHMFTQIVGKIKLALLPWTNHSWHVALYISPTGLTTSDIPYQNQHFQIDFDLIEHKLKITSSTGRIKQFGLGGLSVADFYKKIFEELAGLQIEVKIKPTPVEVESPIPFKEDTIHATYDAEHVRFFHEALLQIQDVLLQFRAQFKGKASPVNFFWGSFDVAFSRFSGRKAPKHPGGIPNLPDWVAEEAYSHEVSSCGFWTGNAYLPYPAFYAYIYPEPEGYKDAQVQPAEAFYHKDFKEFILPYEAVQKSASPKETLLLFLNSTYSTCAALANWDRIALEE